MVSAALMLEHDAVPVPDTWEDDTLTRLGSGAELVEKSVSQGGLLLAIKSRPSGGLAAGVCGYDVWFD